MKDYILYVHAQSSALTRVVYDVGGHLLWSDIARNGNLLSARWHKQWKLLPNQR